MRLDGWIFLVLSWAVIIVTFVFCLTKTLKQK
jgi:hypothetical protein